MKRLITLLPLLVFTLSGFAQGITIGPAVRRPALAGTYTITRNATTGLLELTPKTGSAFLMPIDTGQFRNNSWPAIRRLFKPVGYKPNIDSVTGLTARLSGIDLSLLSKANYVQFADVVSELDVIRDSVNTKAPIALVQALTGQKADSALVALRLIGKQNVRPDLLLAKDYNVVGNGVVSDVNSLTALLATAYGQTGKSTIQLSGRNTYRLTQGITIDISRLTDLILSGAPIDCSSLTAGSGPCITVRGAGTGNPYTQSVSSITKLEVIGPGQSVTGVTGILFDTPGGSDAGTAHMLVQGLSVHGFALGLEFRNNAYLHWIKNAAIWGNAVGVKLALATNNGEGVHIEGAVFNNGVGILQENGQGELLMQGSLDYNTTQVKVTGGRFRLNFGHCEVTSSSSTGGYLYDVSGDGSALYIDGVWMISQDGPLPAYVFNVTTPYDKGGGLFINNLFINNVKTTSGRLATGGGKVTITGGTASYNNWESAPLISESENMVLDGSFEAATIQDNFLATGDQPNTTRYVARNSELSQVNTNARTGSKSLRHYKVFGASSASSYKVLIPIQPGKFTSFELYASKPGTSTGSLFYTAFFVGGITYDASGYPVIGKALQLGTQTLSLTSSALSYTKINCETQPLRAPAWATHYAVLVSADSWVSAGESMYYDDFILNQFNVPLYLTLVLLSALVSRKNRNRKF